MIRERSSQTIGEEAVLIDKLICLYLVDKSQCKLEVFNEFCKGPRKPLVLKS